MLVHQAVERIQRRIVIGDPRLIGAIYGYTELDGAQLCLSDLMVAPPNIAAAASPG